MIIFGYEIKKYKKEVPVEEKFLHNQHFPEYLDVKGVKHLHQCDRRGCTPIPFTTTEAGVIINQ